MEPTATHDVTARARRAGRSPWFGWAGRFGLAAQGVSFAIVAVLALMVATGHGGKTADREDALKTLADETLGGVLLVLVAAGFAAYAAWRFANAFLDREGEGDDPKGLGKRAGDLAKGLLYAALAIGVVRILFRADEGSSGEQRAEEATAGVLGWPGGRWIVFAAAACVAVAALWNVYRGVTRKFEEDLELTNSDVRRWVSRLGLVGLCARGVAFGIIAWFLAKAAYEYDPDEAVSLGGALHKLASATYGGALLGAVAAGLLAFGLFCVAQARYRDV